jgi:hypothetical protein
MAARVLPVDDSYAVLHATRPIGLDTPEEAWFDEDADALLPEPAFSIRAGSFTVNTVVIPVEADDTVHRVLDRITASDAGVTARYDEDTATVTLAAKSGSAPIALADDSSGFLSAVHLDDTAEAQTFPRMRSAFATVFSRMSEYADVNAGVVTLNGQPIVIDPATTTINGFIASVDGSPDVCAVLDQAAGDITLSSRVGGATITLTDTSGLLSVLRIGEGTHGSAVTVTKPFEDRVAPVTAPTYVEPPPAVAPAPPAQLLQPTQPTPFAETQAGRTLAAEQAQGALLLSTTFKPRSPDGAARIRTAPASARRVHRLPVAKPPEEPSPAGQIDQADQQSLEGETTIEAAPPPEVLQPLLDMFLERAGMSRGDGPQRGRVVVAVVIESDCCRLPPRTGQETSFSGRSSSSL